YGNELRGDDGIGPRVARAVEGWGLPGVTALSAHALVPEMAVAVAGAEGVGFGEARGGGGGGGGGGRGPGLAGGRGGTRGPGRVQRGGGAGLLRWAETLGGGGRRAWWRPVRGGESGWGEGLSPQAEGGVAEALGRLAGWALVDGCRVPLRPRRHRAAGGRGYT